MKPLEPQEKSNVRTSCLQVAMTTLSCYFCLFPQPYQIYMSVLTKQEVSIGRLLGFHGVFYGRRPF